MACHAAHHGARIGGIRPAARRGRDRRVRLPTAGNSAPCPCRCDRRTGTCRRGAGSMPDAAASLRSAGGAVHRGTREGLVWTRTGRFARERDRRGRTAGRRRPRGVPSAHARRRRQEAACDPTGRDPDALGTSSRCVAGGGRCCACSGGARRKRALVRAGCRDCATAFLFGIDSRRSAARKCPRPGGLVPPYSRLAARLERRVDAVYSRADRVGERRGSYGANGADG